MNFQLLLKYLEEVKSVIYKDTERAEELLDHVISEIPIKAAQQMRVMDSASGSRSVSPAPPKSAPNVQAPPPPPSR